MYIKILSLLLYFILTDGSSRKEDRLRYCSNLLHTVDWESYYGNATAPSTVEVLNVKDSSGSDACALLLENCEACNCGNSAVILTSPSAGGTDWNLECVTGMQTYTQLEARTLVDEDTSQETYVNQNAETDGEIPPASFADIVAMINATSSQNNEPEGVSTEAPIDAEAAQRLADFEASVTLLNETLHAMEDSPVGQRSLSSASGADSSNAADVVISTLPPSTIVQSQPTTTVSTSTSSTTTSTSTSSTSTAKSAPIDQASTTTTTSTTSTTAEPVEESDDSILKELQEVAEKSTAYYTLLAVFIVFLVLVVVAVAVYFYCKMKKTRSGHAIISPGPDQEPLTPGQGGAFKFDDQM